MTTLHLNQVYLDWKNQPQSTFDELLFYLCKKEWPDRKQAIRFRSELKEYTENIKRLNIDVEDQIKEQYAFQSLGFRSALHEVATDWEYEIDFKKIGQIVGLIAGYSTQMACRKLNTEWTSPKQNASFAYNFIYMITGVAPYAEEVQALDHLLTVYTLFSNTVSYEQGKAWRNMSNILRKSESNYLDDLSLIIENLPTQTSPSIDMDTDQVPGFTREKKE
ncbi:MULTISPECIES: citrate/2-methylcitrate synthase [Paenibacillus]|uniref:citrate/2-methylcitrate synthase n=1 Tax=Paenibacillus TaxID=44249 RepID=UPI001163D2E0|nr:MULTISPECIES: citrate/2-methylcitrate synthase [Paenibacillus]AWP25265.1 hypothetical protein B9D94_00875 [Paenibacillus sp. Cedars]MBX4148572.1 hypothetical protein [Paenibacillus lautus]